MTLRQQIDAMSPARFARAAKRAALLAVKLSGVEQVSPEVRWLADAPLDEIEQRRALKR